MIAKRDRLSRIACSRRAADAMNIGLGDLRQFKIDDMADAVDVDAARRNVGRDQRPRRRRNARTTRRIETREAAGL